MRRCEPPSDRPCPLWDPHPEVGRWQARPRWRTRGLTLAETLVALFLFGIIMTGVGVIFVRGYNIFQHGTSESFQFRAAAIGFDRMDRELRMCEQLYFPSPLPSPLPYLYPPPPQTSIKQGVNKPLVFKRFDANAAASTPSSPYVTSAFTVSPSQNLLRIIYDPGFNPAVPATQTISDPSRQITTFASSVQNFQVTVRSVNGQSFLQVNLTSYPDGAVFPMQSLVGVKSL